MYANTFNISLTPTGSLIRPPAVRSLERTRSTTGVGTGQELTLPAVEYYPMIWLSGRDGGIVSWRKIGYVVTAFSRHGSIFNQKYLPPTGFTPFAPFV
jgi:hypothetical protein